MGLVLTRELVTPVTKAQLPKSLHRIDFPRCNSLQQLLFALPQSNPNVWDALLDNLPKQRSHLHKGCVIRIVKPGLYCDAVIGLQQEVLRYVVNYDGSI